MKAAAAAPDDGDSDEDWSRGSKASRGKKGGKAKKPVRPSCLSPLELGLLFLQCAELNSHQYSRIHGGVCDLSHQTI